MENNEVWKDVKDYEGHYQVSNQGRVKSIKFRKEIIMKPERNKFGYLDIGLRKNGEHKLFKVHRLVAIAFIPNPDNLPQVNHKDENKENNSVENLEWCDSKYNINFGIHNQRISEKLTNGKRSKSVLQFTKDGEFIQEWKSGHDVERNLGYNQRNISHCCLGKYKSAYGYVWKYK